MNKGIDRRVRVRRPDCWSNMRPTVHFDWKARVSERVARGGKQGRVTSEKAVPGGKIFGAMYRARGDEARASKQLRTCRGYEVVHLGADLGTSGTCAGSFYIACDYRRAERCARP